MKGLWLKNCLMTKLFYRFCKLNKLAGNIIKKLKMQKLKLIFFIIAGKKRLHIEENFDQLNARYDEDNEMLKKLIDVRKHLWS